MGREAAGASELAVSLQGKGYRMRNAADLDPLFGQVGDARYDVLLYLDATQALHPLCDVPARLQADVPESYPSGV